MINKLFIPSLIEFLSSINIFITLQQVNTTFMLQKCQGVL